MDDAMQIQFVIVERVRNGERCLCVFCNRPDAIALHVRSADSHVCPLRAADLESLPADALASLSAHGYSVVDYKPQGSSA